MLSTSQKRALAEMKIAMEACAIGVPVLRPMQEHGRYDLALETGSKLLRVQVKWGALIRDGTIVQASFRAPGALLAGTFERATPRRR